MKIEIHHFNFKLTPVRVFLYYSIFVSPLLLILKGLGFVSDDFELLRSALRNPFPALSTWGLMQTLYYRPLIILSFYLNFVISKYQPFFYYLLNFFVHVCCSFLIFLLVSEVLIIIGRSNATTKAFLWGLLFLVLPQNLLNVLWISGRTDLICALFSFLSVYLLLRFIRSKGKINFIFSLLLCVLTYMSKETAVLINFYVVFILIIFRLNRVKLNFLKIVLPYISIAVIYLFFRVYFLHFGSFFYHDSYLGFPLLTFKFYIYGLWSIYSPVGVLDSIYFYLKSPIIFFLIVCSLVALVIQLLFTIKKNSSFNNIATVIITTFALFLTLFIYYSSFPQMRLMYMHYPILILGFSSVEFHYYKVSFNIKTLISIPLIVLLALGNYLIVRRALVTKNYYDNLESILPSYSNYMSVRKIYFLTPLVRISESGTDPYIGLLACYKYQLNFRNKYPKFEKVGYYEGYTLSNIGDSIAYETNEDSIYINIKNEVGIVPFPSKKFRDSTVSYPDFNIIPLHYHHYRYGFASSVLIKLKKSAFSDKDEIIYCENGKLRLTSFKSFMMEHERK